MVKTIHLESALSDEEADKFAGLHLGDDSYDILVSGEDADVYKPDGSTLAKYRHDVLPLELCAQAYSVLCTIKAPVSNRGMAAGRDIPTRRQGVQKVRKKDGTYSRTHYAGGSARLATPGASTGIIGAFDRYIRIPYCRLTAFNLDQPSAFKRVEPFIRAVDAVFAREMPERYAVQKALVDQTPREWVIKDTAFTTITVNQNWQTAVHKDAGDLKQGFGVMTALEGGHYEGCYLCFPKFRVAIDMRTTGVCLADVHEWHGNTPLVGEPGGYTRVSTVLYYRAHIARCGTAEEELTRAKHRRPGDPLYAQDELEREREKLALMGLTPDPDD